MNQDQFMKVITSQYFGALYYGIPIWYDALLKKDKLKMDVLHYNALRLAVKDWGRLYPRDMLDTLDRALPNAFAKYALGSVIMTTMATRFPMRLYIMAIMANHFTTRRKTQCPDSLTTQERRLTDNPSRTGWNQWSKNFVITGLSK